jgi:hypothetical protein
LSTDRDLRFKTKQTSWQQQQPYSRFHNSEAPQETEHKRQHVRDHRALAKIN